MHWKAISVSTTYFLDLNTELLQSYETLRYSPPPFLEPLCVFNFKKCTEIQNNCVSYLAFTDCMKRETQRTTFCKLTAMAFGKISWLQLHKQIIS